MQYAHALKRSACFTQELLLHVTSLQIGCYEWGAVPVKVYISFNTFLFPTGVWKIFKEKKYESPSERPSELVGDGVRHRDGKHCAEF